MTTDPSRPGRRTTLRDVATLAGYSVATVSMALREGSGLPAATVAKVRKAAAKLGYTPDPALGALAAYRSGLGSKGGFSVVAFVAHGKHYERWLRCESARQLLAGARTRAAQLGYSLEIIGTPKCDMNPAGFTRMLLARGVRGVLLAPFQNPGDTFEMDWSRFSVVAIERPHRYGRLHHVAPDYYADLRQAWEKLRALGYRRIGLAVAQGLAERSGHRWEAAMAFEQSRVPAAERVPSITPGAGDTAGVAAWLREHRPDAVIARDAGIFEAAKTLGLSIPRDLGYADLNVVDAGPEVGGILQPREAMGVTAVDILHGLMVGGKTGLNAVPTGTRMEGAWVDGKTVRRKTSRAGRD